MTSPKPLTLFALDCGATNWRLYRMEYEVAGSSARLLAEPQPAPMTSFVDRRLPAVICLDPSGAIIESYGETAQQQLEDEHVRERVREHFKPCIGAHLEENPLPHQKRYTHTQALAYTQMLLRALLDQIRQEKWRSAAFDDRICFTFAYPVHWRYDHEGRTYAEFVQSVRACFDPDFEQIRFVAEPEGALLLLQHRGQMEAQPAGQATWIIDIGGSTTDIVMGRSGEKRGAVEFLGRYGGPFGGGLYDAEIAKCIADDLKIPASALADDPSAMISLRVSAQRLKESLSRQMLNAKAALPAPQRTVTLVTRDGRMYRRVVVLDETRFREICRPLDDSFRDIIEHALAAAGIREEDIGQIVLVGGGSQLFTIIRYLRERFGNAKIVLADNPEEIVVQGIGLAFGAATDATPAPSNTAGAASMIRDKEAAALHRESGWKLQTSEGKNIALFLGQSTVGRSEGNEVQLDDRKVSRFHAVLNAATESLKVTDLGSINGTTVNGERLPPNQPRSLTEGDVILFGDTKYICIR